MNPYFFSDEFQVSREMCEIIIIISLLARFSCIDKLLQKFLIFGSRLLSMYIFTYLKHYFFNFIF